MGFVGYEAESNCQKRDNDDQESHAKTKLESFDRGTRAYSALVGHTMGKRHLICGDGGAPILEALELMLKRS